MLEPDERAHDTRAQDALKGERSCLATRTRRTCKALFRCKKFLDFDTVAFSFLFDKHCLIME